MTFVNTIDGFAWLTLYLETVVSSLAWKPSTAATIAKLYRRQAEEWVKKTDPNNLWLVDYMCHDFSARGLDPMSQYLIGLGHATSFKGSDTLPVIPAARYFYNEPENEVCINSVNASEHSVSTTKIFTVGEQQMIADWLKIFDKGILSIVADTFDLWKLITEYLPANKEAIMARDGKLVIRPDSGDPVDIICGYPEIIPYKSNKELTMYDVTSNNYEKFICNGKLYEYDKDSYDDFREEFGEHADPDINDYITELDYEQVKSKGVIELLWDIFGGTINEQGYKVLDPHIGAIYGDSITPERQRQIYERLAAKGFAATNIVLGVGSFTYQYNTRDTLGFAAKGAWFEVKESCYKYPVEIVSGSIRGEDIKLKVLENPVQYDELKSYNIYKDPVTDDGTKKSLKGLQMVYVDEKGEYQVKSECTFEKESKGILQVIYEDGKFYNQITLKEVREKLK